MATDVARSHRFRCWSCMEKLEHPQPPAQACSNRFWFWSQFLFLSQSFVGFLAFSAPGPHTQDVEAAPRSHFPKTDALFKEQFLHVGIGNPIECRKLQSLKTVKAFLRAKHLSRLRSSTGNKSLGGPRVSAVSISSGEQKHHHQQWQIRVSQEKGLRKSGLFESVH